jgi:hypothetical protein
MRGPEANVLFDERSCNPRLGSNIHTPELSELSAPWFAYT